MFLMYFHFTTQITVETFSLFVIKAKNNHENTKYGKHEIRTLSLFRAFVINKSSFSSDLPCLRTDFRTHLTPEVFLSSSCNRRKLLNIEQGTAELRRGHFDIRYSLFDILRFSKIAYKTNSYHGVKFV